MVAHAAPEYTELDREVENFRAFHKELQALINKHGLEKYSNTPDFVLAEYLMNCLKCFDLATGHRETFYGRAPQPVPPDQCPQPAK